MKSLKKRNQLNVFMTLAGVICAGALRTAAILTEWDPVYHYFSSNLLKGASEWVLAVTAVLLIAEALFNLRRRELKVSFSTPATYVPAGLFAAAALFAAPKLLGAYLELDAGSYSYGLTSVLLPIAAVLAVVSAIGVIVFVACSAEGNHIRAVFTLAISIFLALLALIRLMSNDVPINAPNKTVDQITLALCAIYFLYEARLCLGRERWSAYTAFAGIAALTCGYSSIPALIAYFAKGYTVSAGIYENLITLTLFVFITARLALTNSLPYDRECAVVKALSPLARERSSQIEAADRNFEELCAVIEKNGAQGTATEDRDENQISIEDLSEVAIVETDLTDPEMNAQPLPEGDAETPPASNEESDGYI